MLRIKGFVEHSSIGEYKLYNDQSAPIILSKKGLIDTYEDPDECKIDQTVLISPIDTKELILLNDTEVPNSIEEISNKLRMNRLNIALKPMKTLGLNMKKLIVLLHLKQLKIPVIVKPKEKS